MRIRDTHVTTDSYLGARCMSWPCKKTFFYKMRPLGLLNYIILKYFVDFPAGGIGHKNVKQSRTNCCILRSSIRLSQTVRYIPLNCQGIGFYIIFQAIENIAKSSAMPRGENSMN